MTKMGKGLKSLDYTRLGQPSITGKYAVPAERCVLLIAKASPKHKGAATGAAWGLLLRGVTLR